MILTLDSVGDKIRHNGPRGFLGRVFNLNALVQCCRENPYSARPAPDNPKAAENESPTAPSGTPSSLVWPKRNRSKRDSSALLVELVLEVVNALLQPDS